MPTEHLELSYSHGVSLHPLLGETIGANLKSLRRDVPGRRGARRVRDRPALDLP